MSFSNGNKSVYIGGVVDLVGFTKHERIADLLKTGKVGFYMQENAITTASQNGSLTSIAAAMAETGSGEAEINIQGRVWFDNCWDKIWREAGLSPKRINAIIDFSRDGWFNLFTETVDAAKIRGVTSVAPIFSPNDDTMSLYDFALNPKYADIIKAARYGGGLALDPPPNYFFTRGKAYQEFSYTQLRWARENNLRSTVIISPYGDDYDFRNHVIEYVGLFKKHHALPNSWAIEIYNSDNNPDIGSTHEPNSIVSIALWLAENAPIL